MSNKYCFAIDRGGTFTDVLCICPNNEIKTLKLLSEDPERYSDAPTEGIRRILQQETNNAIDPTTGLVEIDQIGWVRMGTTVATNALLERKGDPVALIVNEGFKDLLYIGNQARPKIFDLNVRKPSNLYKKVIEINCRIVPAKQPGVCSLENSWKTLNGISSGMEYKEMIPLNDQEIEEKLKIIKDEGITSLAIVLAHSYACPDHEIRIGEIAKRLGFPHVTLSHQAMPMSRIVPRGYTGCAEAYLTPHVERYLESFRSGFKNQLNGVDVLFMQSDGGLTKMENFRGARAILSGPAGGVVGYAKTGRADVPDMPLIGFDMGGTSTDVSRFAEKYEYVIESTTAGITIQAPQLDINTVAAGGGSMLFFRSGLFVVGPESAGAHPGPACYKKGGPLTVTDANLILGRLLPEYFPNIFGHTEKEPLDYETSKLKFSQLTDNINKYLLETGERTVPFKIEEVAMGFIRVANESMCRPIRAITQSRGLDTSRHALACFGGAGGQHACSIARELGMSKVLVHKYAGVLSAYGMALADVVHETQQPLGMAFITTNTEIIKQLLDKLRKECKEKLLQQGFKLEEITLEPYLHLRYDGTDCALMCVPYDGDRLIGDSERISNVPSIIPEYGDFYTTFSNRYRSEFGFIIPGRKIIVDDVRIRGSGCTLNLSIQKIPTNEQINEPKPVKYTQVFYETIGYAETKIFLAEHLLGEQIINGPAIVIDKLSTILIEPGSFAQVTVRGDLIISIGSRNNDAGTVKSIDERLDAIQLSIFSHRFMSIAEQMGRTLQRTSISTNIKERLDFSCALFGPDGGLVSNAPHIPVHLGSMQEAVQFQLKFRGDSLKPGDVLLTNHPQAGGSHLPDLTVITPVFHIDDINSMAGGGVSSTAKPVFYVASRGHHADIGGITPGSMPPHSTLLAQEGAAFKSFLLVENGNFQEEELTAQLCKIPENVPGATGTRNLSDNISDLKAQVAANQKGIQLVGELIKSYSLRVVQAYMNYIQQNAEVAVRDMLKEIAKNAKLRTGQTILKAEQHMDDGTPICLTVTINEETGSAIADFNGTGCEVWGNCNTPRAITLSALIYCLRCMVGHDVPLNQGCLAPIEIRIPKNSILDPSDGAAVVGGNVLTSQRVVDTVLSAFQVCAASQGCMNNTTIGDEHWGYYETVAGGTGAGPGFHGTDGVHSHMTNTRITDPEILENRYPIIVKRFCLRDDQSGGRGEFHGGEGVWRELLFRKPVTLSVLTERRTLQPYGMAGGEPGKRGLNLLIKKNGRCVNLGGKSAVNIEAGDVYSMRTPGGGGYGISNGVNNDFVEKSQNLITFLERGSVYEYRQTQESC